MREAQMCRKARRSGEGAQYIISLLGVWLPEPDALPGLVMEYADGGNLLDYLKRDDITLSDRLNRVSKLNQVRSILLTHFVSLLR